MPDDSLQQHSPAETTDEIDRANAADFSGESEGAAADRRFRRRGRVATIVMCLLLPVIGIGAHLTLNDISTLPSRWLPKSADEHQSLRRFIDEFESGDSVILSWPGCTVDDERLADLEAAIADIRRSKKRPREAAYFDRTMSGYSALKELTSPPLNLPREEALQRLKGSLVGGDGRFSCAVIALTEKGLYERQRAIEMILDEAGKICKLEKDEFLLAGPPVESAFLDTEAEFDANVLSVPSTIVAALLCWWCLRSWRYAVVLIAAAVFGQGIVLAAMHAFDVRMSALLIVLPTLVLVLTVSAGVHLVNYYYDAVHRSGFPGAALQALRSGRRPCILAAVTTACGLISLVVSHIQPVVQFGLFAAFGVLSSIAILLLILPGALARWPNRSVGDVGTQADISQALPSGASTIVAETPVVDGNVSLLSAEESTTAASRQTAPSRSGSRGARRFDAFWNAMAGLIRRHATWISVLFVGMTLLGAIGLKNIETSISFESLFAADSRLARDYKILERELGPLVPLEVVVHFAKDNSLTFWERLAAVRNIEREMADIDHVDGTLSAATFVPAVPARATPADIADATRLPQDWGFTTGASVPSSGSVEQSTLRRTLEFSSPSSVGTSESTPQTTRRRIWEFSSTSADPRITNVLWSTDGGEGSPGESLRRDLVERNYLFQSNDRQSWRISARVPALLGIDHAQALKRVKQRVEPLLADLQADKPGTVWAEYTGVMPVVSTTQRVLLEDLYRSFLTAFGLVAVVMILVLGSLRAGLLAMLPNMYPAIMIFGLMGWLGIPVDIGAMMTASVALGIAVDDTLHFLTWYRIEISRGCDSGEAVRRCFGHCARAMTQTTIICGLGMLVFALSGFVPTQRFAWLMLALLVAALAGDLIFLPALLNSVVGRSFSAGKVRKPATIEAPLIL
jgi:hypothetical protein